MPLNHESANGIKITYKIRALRSSYETLILLDHANFLSITQNKLNKENNFDIYIYIYTG